MTLTDDIPDLHMGRVLLKFHAWAALATGALSLAVRTPTPFLGAVIAGAIFVPFAYWLESLDA